jgi:hypothetical protein
VSDRVSAIPVAKIGKNAINGANKGLLFTLPRSLVSHLIPPIAITTAIYRKLSEGLSIIYPIPTPTSEDSIYFFGTAAEKDAPNGARLPRTAPLETSKPHTKYIAFVKIVAVKSFTGITALLLTALLISIF